LPVDEHGSMLATGFEDSLLGMALVSPDGRFLRVNRALCHLLGRTEEELATLTYADVTHPDDVELSQGNIVRSLAGAVRGFKLQKRYLHADGREIWAVLTSSLLRDAEGVPLCFFSQVLDLSDQGPDLEPSTGEAPMQFVAVCDSEGRFTDVSPVAFHFFGLRPDDLRGRSAFDVLHPDDMAATRAVLQGLLAHPGAIVPVGRVRVTDRHSTWRTVEVNATNLLHQPAGGIRIGARLVERPRPDTDAGPAGRLLVVEPDERARISRELHDGLGQILTSIALFAKTIEDDVPLAQRRRVTSLRKLVDDALVSTRSLVWSLRPPELNRSGLLSSLARLAQGAREQAGLRVDFDGRGLVDPLSPTTEATVYRFVQEALGNVMRHAAAGSVAIVLSRSDSRLITVVEDDGQGFEPAAVATAGGVGLHSMRERARLAGGEVSIESAPGRGTLLRLDIPCAALRPAVR
jgi:PAS domain S-box-containing protein